MSTYTINDVYYQLGYPESMLLPNPDASGNPLPSTSANVASIIDNLIGVDASLTSAAGDAMAIQVGDLKVDFVRGTWSLKLEGSRQIGLLSALTGVPVYYDKYKGRKPGDPSITPLTVKAAGNAVDIDGDYDGTGAYLYYNQPQVYFNI